MSTVYMEQELAKVKIYSENANRWPSGGAGGITMMNGVNDTPPWGGSLLTSHLLPPSWRWPPSGTDGGELSKHARAIAETLRREGPSTRRELMTSARLSRPTVSNAVAELLAHELVDIDDRDWAGAGPRPGVVSLNRRAGVVVGLDIGRSHIQVIVASLAHQEITRYPADLGDRYPADLGEGSQHRPHEVLDRAAQLVRQLLEQEGIPVRDILGVGLGLPAPITRHGEIGSETYLPGWTGMHPAPELSRRLDDVPVLLENDAALGALGEFVFGAGRNSRELTYLKLATGIGAGIVREGRLHRGAAGTTGELGHVTINFNGPQCRCRNRGCLETYASGATLLASARNHAPDLADLPSLVDEARSGDETCRGLITEAGRMIGIALGTLVNINSPDRIVVGGDLSAAGEILLAPLRATLAVSAVRPAANAVTILPAQLKSWSSAWGAVALVLKTPGPPPSPLVG
jgi:predicted NBD/HSP70 family sugar kinase